MSSPERLIEKLTGDITRMQRKMAALSGRIQSLEGRTRRLDALRRPDPDVGHRIDALASILQPQRVIDSIHRAVRDSSLADRPCPHLVLGDLLPADAYDALLEAVPPPEFFDEDERRKAEHLMVRTSLMPIDSTVTWMFVTAVVAPALAAAVMARFDEALARGGIIVVSPRIVRHRPGYVAPAADRAASGTAMAVIYLARPGDGAEYGSRLHAPGAAASIDIPFRRNTALALLGAGDLHEYASIPSDPGAAVVRDAYQFGIESRPVRRVG